VSNNDDLEKNSESMVPIYRASNITYVQLCHEL
jgi:hypothetical protein